MGMGYGANYADVIKPEAVAKIVPDAYKAFEDALKAMGIDFEELCRIIAECDNDNGHEQACQDAMEALNDAFYKATITEDKGLQLCSGYHREDDGDRYDEVTGGYFELHGVYQKSPAAERFADVLGLERRFYVNFG